MQTSRCLPLLPFRQAQTFGKLPLACLRSLCMPPQGPFIKDVINQGGGVRIVYVCRYKGEDFPIVYVYNFHSDAQICQMFFPRSRTMSLIFDNFPKNITTTLKIRTKNQQKIQCQIFIWEGCQKCTRFCLMTKGGRGGEKF